MINARLRRMAVVVCFVGVSCFDGLAAEGPAGDAKAIEGLWRGSWGGGPVNGVFRQPVIAELLIQGDRVALAGFPPRMGRTGTVRFDPSAKRMEITPTVEAGDRRTPRAVAYTYQIKGDELTLIDSEKVSLSFRRRPVAHRPLADVQVQLVAASGINDAGELRVTAFTPHRVGRSGATCFEPKNRSLSTKQAIVFLVQETGLKRVTVDDARKLLRKSTPVVVAYRHDDRTLPQPSGEFWKEELESPSPDSDAVGQTFSQVLRPGTLVFVLSSRENVPRP